MPLRNTFSLHSFRFLTVVLVFMVVLLPNVIYAAAGDRITYKVNGVEFTMVIVEGGTFTMGATPEQGNAREDEKPAHQVTLSTFGIGETEVTQALWEAVMGSNPSHFKGRNLPVESVSWEECQVFIRKLNALTGVQFRLPTEAEWEYAARGGRKSQGYRYSGSNTIDDVAWYTKNSGDRPHAVGTKRANELGLYDMSGNVSEWCQDWGDTYPSSAQHNPQGPSAGLYRVERNGCWGSYPSDCRVAYRFSIVPIYHGDATGLRLACTATPSGTINKSTAQQADKREYTVNGVSFTMVAVEGGTFTSGPLPTRQITLSSYYIGETEVTQALWQAVMGSNPSHQKGDNLPVTKVSWKDCQLFIQKLNDLTGARFRMPTEAEWQFAARGGTKSHNYQYSGSSMLDEVGWYEENSDKQVHPVKGKLPNELGLYDMSGNVWEWCQDWWGGIFTSDPQVDPTGPSSGNFHVIHGGSWKAHSSDCRISRRNPGGAIGFSDMGLRLAQ